MVAEYGLRRMAAPPLGERQINHAAVFLQGVASNADALRFRRRAKFYRCEPRPPRQGLRLLLRLGAGNLGFGFGAGCDDFLLTFIANTVHRVFGGDCVVLGFHRGLDRCNERI